MVVGPTITPGRKEEMGKQRRENKIQSKGELK